jgi:hypothetical protein
MKKPKCEHKWKIVMEYSNPPTITAFCECGKVIDVAEILHRLNEYSAMKRELKATKKALETANRILAVTWRRWQDAV